MYVISKLDIKNQIVTLEGSYKNSRLALTALFELINHQDEYSYVNKINSHQYIRVYKIIKGYLYNTKELHYIYQLLKVDPPQIIDEKKEIQ